MSVSDERLAELLDADEYDAEITMAEIMVMARALQALREQERWIPVSERLPPVGKAVLCKADGPSKVFSGNVDPDGTWWDYNRAMRDPAWWRDIGPLPGEVS